MFRSLFIVGFLYLVIGGCSSDSSNTEASEETACTAATGTWYIQSYSCDGVDQGYVLDVNFSLSAGTFALNLGSQDCQTTANFTMAPGLTAAAVELTGSGNLVCTENSAVVTSCSDGSRSCTNADSIAGVDNSIDSCVVTGGTMAMSRTITATSANFSGCSEGQAEAITLTQTPVTLPAQLLILASDPADFGDVVVGGTTSRTLEVLNNNAVTVTSMAGAGLASPFSFAGGAYPGTGGTCGLTLAAGATCDLVITFAPTVAGAVTDTLLIDHNAGSAVQLQFGVSGNGVTPASLLISETNPYDFGSVSFGMTSTHTFTVTNIGGGSATSMIVTGLVTPFGLAGGSFPGTGGTCNGTTGLAGGSSCTIVVEFAPVTFGVVNDTLILQYYNGSSNQQTNRNLVGTGI